MRRQIHLSAFLVLLLNSATGLSQTVPADGIAAKYQKDVGIGRDSRVIFADNFEGWEPGTAKPPAGTWDAVRNNKNSGQRQTLVQPGKLTIGSMDVEGKNVLVLSCWHGSPNTAGLRRDLGNYQSLKEGRGAGYEEVFVRYYQKLDPEYRPERNHGSNLGGRDLTHADCWWVGMANTKDVASHGYFYSGLQPYDEKARRLYWGFYSYHLDKPTPWGDDYKPRSDEKKTIDVGRWYSLERHMKLNSVDPVKSDGVEELWVDGKLAIRREGLRFRSVPSFRITVFELEVYYHALPVEYTEQKPARVYFDNVVVATERIGCLNLGLR